MSGARQHVTSRAAEMAEAIAEAERTDADDGHVVRLPLTRDEWLEAEYTGQNLTHAVGSPYRDRQGEGADTGPRGS